MFCVQCGREVGEELVGGLCHACFREKSSFSRVPLNVDFEVCAHCGARRRGEVWVHPRPEDAWEYVVEQGVRDAVEVDRPLQEPRVRVRLEPEDERNFTVHVTVTGVAEGVPVEETHEARARVKNATCLRCSRYMGGYFESIVQVRAEGRPLAADELRQVRVNASRHIERIVGEGDSNAFVLKDEEVHGGLDIYVGTNQAGRTMAKSIAQELGGRIRDHPKLVGQTRDGRDMYRITYAVRIPGYRIGEFVAHHGELMEVTAITPKLTSLRGLRDGRPHTAERDDLEHAAVYRRDEARDAVVVDRRDGELDVLDPWTYETVTVLAPPGGAPPGDAVPVLRWEGELVVLPTANAP